MPGTEMKPVTSSIPRSRPTVGLPPLALMVALVACDGGPFAPERDSEAPIQTDRLVYELEKVDGRLETRIGYSFTNRGPDPVFIQNCNGATGIALQRRIDGVWTTVWANVIPACISQAIALLPGQSLSGELVVDADCGCGVPRFMTSDFEGVYRLVFQSVYDAQTGDGLAGGDLVPVERRRSNGFTLDD